MTQSYLYRAFGLHLFLSHFLSSFMMGLIGVPISLTSSKPNFFSISLMYLAWLMKIPSLHCLTCRPRKNVISPIMLISNSLCISLAKCSHKLTLHFFSKVLTQALISSTKYYIININLCHKYIMFMFL